MMPRRAVPAVTVLLYLVHVSPCRKGTLTTAKMANWLLLTHSLRQDHFHGGAHPTIRSSACGGGGCDRSGVFPDLPRAARDGPPAPAPVQPGHLTGYNDTGPRVLPAVGQGRAAPDPRPLP